MGISGFLALNENPELWWTALTAELPPMLLPRFDIRNSLARKSTDMQRLLCARPSQSLPVWRTLGSIVVDLNTKVLKHFPRLKLVLSLIVQANNSNVIFWGRNNCFCSQKCLFTSLFGRVCPFRDEKWNKQREKPTCPGLALILAEAKSLLKFRSCKAVQILFYYILSMASSDLLLEPAQSSFLSSIQEVCLPACFV